MSKLLVKGPPRRTLLIATLAALSIGCSFYSALNAPLGADYPGPACRGCDLAGPPIQALVTGHLHRFFATQPFMGSASLLLRAPAVAIARSFGAGELSQYRIGCLICLLVSAALALVLVSKLRPHGKQWILAAVFLVLILCGPVTAKALKFGHPEELLGAMLCVVGIVLAAREQVVIAGVSLGLAVATKQWALLAVLPAVIASPRQRALLVAVAAGAAAVFILPMLIADPAQFLAQNQQASMPPINTDLAGITPTNVWFPYAHLGGVVVHGGMTTLVYRLPPALSASAHPALLILGFGLPLIFWARARRLALSDVLLLTAVVLLLRCILDPVSLSYHHLPFFVAIASYEALSRRRVPVISIYSAGAIWTLSDWVAPSHSATALNQLYLAWALPLTAFLAYRSFALGTRGWRPERRLRRTASGAVAAEVR